MDKDSILKMLKAKGNREALEGMARYGIRTDHTYGASVPAIRTIAKKVGKDHRLALELWGSGLRDARLLASMVDDHRQVTEAQMDNWVADFDSWDVCDGCCGNLFDRTPFARKKALEWSRRKEEFVRRAGFVMMAEIAVHDKKAPDSDFSEFLKAIERGSGDDRNFVKKAVNWALRQIGKRNRALNQEAVALSKKLLRSEARSARWIGSDALRELTSDGVKARLRRSS